jgi:membrane associated rhomboid family serine protease
VQPKFQQKSSITQSNGNTMKDLFLQFQHLISLIQGNQAFLLSAIGILWGIHLLNFILGYRLNCLGIYPRHLRGLAGIIFSPFLHGDFNHLFFNTIPLYVLANFILLGGVLLLYQVTAVVVLVSGVLIWLFSRRGLHIGASGLIMGYWGYLIMNAYAHPSIMTVFLVLVTLYYFGGLASALLPTSEQEVSWEGHIFGFISGLVANYFF